MLMMAHRRLVNDDPIVFALKDRISIIAGLLIADIVLPRSEGRDDEFASERGTGPAGQPGG